MGFAVLGARVLIGVGRRAFAAWAAAMARRQRRRQNAIIPLGMKASDTDTMVTVSRMWTACVRYSAIEISSRT